MSAPHSSAPARDREPFMAFVTEDATLDVLQSAAVEMDWRADACRKGGVRAAVQALSVAASPTILMIDLSDSAQPLADIDSLAEVCEPGTIVVATGRINDVTLFRDLVARGVHDYLVKPLSPATLREALERARNTLAAPRDKSAEEESARVAAAVVGTRGGVGASMLATSVAWLLSSEHRRSTALLDLDVHFGTGALVFDLEPGRGLTDAIEDPQRIDGLFIERAMSRVSDRLAIMSAEAPLSAGLMSDGSAFVRLEHEFRQGFEATVVDLPRTMMLNFPHLLGDISTIILVAELTLASARDSIRILAWLKSNAPAARILVVVNKLQPGAGEISQTDFAAALERRIDFTIPHDYKAAAQAARLGQTFAEANRASKTVAPLVELAREIAEPRQGTGKSADKAAPSRSLLGRIDLKAVLAKKGRAAAPIAT